MSDLGKVDRAFFEEYIYPNLGADCDDVAVGPRHGVDFGVVDVDGTALVTATDPVSILPGLGWERAARFALGVVLADVAVSGLAPSHLSVSFHLPPEMDDEAFAAVWTAMDETLTDLGTAVVTGHTARYSGCAFPWVGGATAMAVGDHDDVVRPDGARPGDRLIVTTGAGVEAASLFASLYPEQIPADEETLDDAAARLPGVDHVRGAVAAAAAGPVTAMHDATEGGLHGALHELASGAGVRIEFDRDAVPLPDDTRAVAAALDFDPWRATSSGTLLVTAPPEATDRVLAALRDEGLAAAAVGEVLEGKGVAADGEDVPKPEGDSSWPVYDRLATE
ncbi:hydrogenase expression protein [Halostella sp. JP-L12]|uniref:AIR synthase family protein n=1 Tax=Halostella TaxID=1843185 RepID=UPI000EF79045|nr:MULTISPECIES: AIR synthase family protein [Halostella]NHN47877.1 hydrogenase expression protein [Halostella sp. JP-L12]